MVVEFLLPLPTERGPLLGSDANRNRKSLTRARYIPGGMGGGVRIYIIGGAGKGLGRTVPGLSRDRRVTVTLTLPSFALCGLCALLSGLSLLNL